MVFFKAYKGILFWSILRQAWISNSHVCSSSSYWNIDANVKSCFYSLQAMWCAFFLGGALFGKTVTRVYTIKSYSFYTYGVSFCRKCYVECTGDGKFWFWASLWRNFDEKPTFWCQRTAVLPFIEYIKDWLRYEYPYFMLYWRIKASFWYVTACNMLNVTMPVI